MEQRRPQLWVRSFCGITVTHVPKYATSQEGKASLCNLRLTQVSVWAYTCCMYDSQALAVGVLGRFKNQLRPHKEVIAQSRLVPGGHIRGHGWSPAERCEERQGGGQHSRALQDQRRGIRAAACLTHLPDGCLLTAACAWRGPCLYAPCSMAIGYSKTSVFCTGFTMSIWA